MVLEALTSIDAKELRGLAQRVLEHKETKGFSWSVMLKRYPDLGSDSTVSKILKNDMGELNLEGQLARFRCVVNAIDSLREDKEDEEIYEDIGPALEARRVYLETAGETSNARVIIIEGDTGTGKTFACRALAKKYGQKLLLIEASEAWGDKPNALFGAILLAKGRKLAELPASQFERQELTIEVLNSVEVCVSIDEAHHMGPKCLNEVKTLVNRTRCTFILPAMKTLWARLVRNNYQEVKQLTGNRLAERIKLGLREADVRKLVERKVGDLSSGDMKQVLKVLLEKAPEKGNLAFVREVCKDVLDSAGKDPVTFEIFNRAVTAQEGKR